MNAKNRLPLHPNLGYYRKRAKELKRALAAGDAAAARKLAQHHPRPPTPAQATLGDAQLVLAREHGFATWAEFKTAVETTEGPPPTPADLLCGAIRVGDPDLVAEMLAAHPGVAATQDGAGRWPLVEACDRGRLEIVRLLLDAGADPVAGNPLAAAAHAGPHKPRPALDVVALLLARGAPNDLATHAMLGHSDEVRRRLAAGADLRGAEAVRALFLAGSNGHVDAVRALLEAGVDPTLPTPDGQHVWQRVWLHTWGANYRAIARLLLDHGVVCSFHEACEVGHVPTVARLLAEDPTRKDAPAPAGRTPIETAVINADAELARVLVTAGAADPKGQGRALVDGPPRRRENLAGTVFRNCTFDRANFHDSSLADTVFADIDLSGAHFHNVNLSNVRIESAFIRNLTIWGIDVVPLLEAEQRRRAGGKS